MCDEVNEVRSMTDDQIGTRSVHLEAVRNFTGKGISSLGYIGADN